MARNNNKLKNTQKINKVRLEQEQQKLLALRKKNDGFLPDRLEDGSCRLCGEREYSEQEKHDLAVEIERMMFGPFTAEEEEDIKINSPQFFSSL